MLLALDLDQAGLVFLGNQQTFEISLNIMAHFLL